MQKDKPFFAYQVGCLEDIYRTLVQEMNSSYLVDNQLQGVLEGTLKQSQQTMH